MLSVHFLFVKPIDSRTKVKWLEESVDLLPVDISLDNWVRNFEVTSSTV
jgi:hypothetical protein